MANAECSNPPFGQCTFYSDCLEAKYHCGPTGYPIGYGKKYCEKFSASEGEFGEEGQRWMLGTMHCLQMALVPEATAIHEQPSGMQASGQSSKACQDLQNKAFASHAGCYLSNGLCELPVSDWFEIVRVVDLKTLFGSWDAFVQSVEAAEGCLMFYAWLISEKVANN